MDFKSFRIAGRGFTVFDISPLTAERIIKSMNVTDVDSIKDCPECLKQIARGVSFAVVGSGLFSKTRSYFLYKKIKRKASFNELFEAYKLIIEMIPIDDITMIASVFKHFSSLISKDNE